MRGGHNQPGSSNGDHGDPNGEALLRCGDRVMSLWSDEEYYPGIVADIVSTDGVYSIYSIAYDNGALDNSVPAHAVRKQTCRIPILEHHGKAGAKIQAKQRLRDAANAGDADTVVRCLQDGVRARFFDVQGYTPLHWAAGPEDGMQADTPERQRCVAALAKASDINALDKTREGMRAIDHAIRHNLAGCVSILVDRGANVTGAAHWAVTFHAYGALRALLKPHAATAFATSKAWAGCTPLMLCCRNGDSRALRILLQAAAAHGGSTLRDVVVAVQASSDRLTPLHFAVEVGSAMCVRMLLEHGADPSMPCGRGEHALSLAQRRAGRTSSGAGTDFDARAQCEELLLSAVATAALRTGERLGCVLSLPPARYAGTKSSQSAGNPQAGRKLTLATSTPGASAAPGACARKQGKQGRLAAASAGSASAKGEARGGGARGARKRKPRGGGAQGDGAGGGARGGCRRVKQAPGVEPAATAVGAVGGACESGGCGLGLSVVTALEAGGDEPLCACLPPLMEAEAFHFGGGCLMGGSLLGGCMLGACQTLDSLRHSASSPLACIPVGRVDSSAIGSSSPLSLRRIPGGCCDEDIPRGCCDEVIRVGGCYEAGDPLDPSGLRGDEMLGDVLGDVQGLESAWEER